MMIALWGLGFLQKKIFIDRRLQNVPKNKISSVNVPDPVWPKWKQRLSFTVRDDRPSVFRVQNRVLFFLILLVGLVVSIIAALVESWGLLLVGYAMFFVAVIFSQTTAKPVLDTRKSVVQRMYEIATSKGLVASSERPEDVVSVLEWVDYVTPKKAQFRVRTEFSNMGEKPFLEQFNQVFGQETTWIAWPEHEEYLECDGKRVSEKKADKLAASGKEVKKVVKTIPGFNYEKGIATIGSTPPLPKIAPLKDYYILNDDVAWSFFPIALGVEDGLEITNPETGKTEHVLGYDVAGEQAKLSKKRGTPLSPKITTSPMVYVGGSTGGGKALKYDTPIKCFTNVEKDEQQAESEQDAS